MSKNKNNENRQDKIFSILSKISVWVGFFGILYLLRSFFLLIFLTFIFSYIQAHGIEKLEKKIKNRIISVVIVFLGFFALLVLTGGYLVPRVVDQAKLFADKYPSYFESLDREIVTAVNKYPVLNSVLSDEDKARLQETSEQKLPGEKPISLSLIQSMLGFGEEINAKNNVRQVVTLAQNIGQPLLAIGSAFLLSLMFSVMILLDLPRLQQSMEGLSNTRVGFLYDEVAPSIRDFARVVGSAFEAQTIIAFLTTLLTAGIIYILDVQRSIAFLSIIVFFCSFVPVAGVFISSVPICLLALQKGGVNNLLLAIALIWGIHIVQAYIMNPKVYGDKLKINPVLVLIILTIAGKLFHIWGLLLSLPVYTYVFGHAIKEKTIK